MVVKKETTNGTTTAATSETTTPSNQITAKKQQQQQVNESNDPNNNTITPATESETADAATTEENGSATGNNNDSELILIQDNAFTVKIQVPGLDAFELQVTSMELVQEIHQMLMDKEETCHRTCFSLQLDGVTLDNFNELKNIDGLKDGSVLKLVEEPYTVRDVRLHVRHINDLIHSIDPLDLYNGVNCNSLTFVNDITNTDSNADKRAARGATTEVNEFQTPEYVLPNIKDVPVMPLHLNGIKTKPPACLKQLTFSGWNPPIGKRKMKGDLMYLHIITCEDKRYHITASTKGFFVNQSTDDVFNPKAENSKQIYHSLVDLLVILSPSFKKNFQLIQRKRTQKHPFERIGTPFQLYSWLSPDYEHNVDWFRAEDSNASKLGHEDHIPGHSRDWNEEIQATKELPKKTLPERLIRERAMFKVHSDFVAAATRGAMAVVDGNIMAINPGEDSKIQMFIWNNMFFSLGFDVKDHYKEFGGDFAAYMAPIYDLQGVKALNGLDIDGLYTLGTVVIDYRGYRVTAQSIIPGILEKDQDQSVVYGSTDFGKACASHPKYVDYLNKVCTALKLRPHKIKLENNEEITIYSSIECKGIIGNDGRHYILDLLRTFPPDLNYNDFLNQNSNDENSKKKFRHRLCSLRQELIETFVDTKYIQFVKYAAYNFQQMNKKRNELEQSAAAAAAASAIENKEKEIESTETAKKVVEKISEAEENSEEVIQNACNHIGSLKTNEFDIRFNANLYQPVVKLADDQKTIDADVKLLKEAAESITNIQLPLLIKDLLEHVLFITDGVTLCETLHSRGINIRYLGQFVDLISKHEALNYVYVIAVNELVGRCAKRLFRNYLQNVPSHSLSSAVAHFLNCYLSSFTKSPSSNSNSTTSTTVKQTTETATTTVSLTNGTNGDANESKAVNKKKKKNQKKNGRYTSQEFSDWSQLTARSLWSNISEESSLHYNYEITLENNNIDEVINKYRIRKLILLRQFCQKNGVQMVLREYNFENKHKEVFHEDDVLNLFPVVKHVPPKASDAYNFFTNGQNKIQQGYLKEGFELISESYNLLSNVYGALHPEICMCLRLLSRLNYILGDYTEAMLTQHKAVMMSERLYGIDHSQTITDYTHLALYAFANGQVQNSLKYLYRARYLLLVVYGEDHPEMTLIDSNLGLILQAAGEYDNAIKFLEKSLELNKKYFGPKSMKTALAFHLLARLQSCRGDFRTALMNERETYQIYKGLLGEEHERTKESAQVLKHLTEQAVLLQKKMNEIYKGEKVSFPPIQIQQPSLQTVLGMLNIINGIIFIPSKEEEIEKIRDELNKITNLQQQQQQQQNKIEEGSNQNNEIKINSQDDDLQ